MDFDRSEGGAARARDARALRLDIGILVLGNAAILAADVMSGSHTVWLLWAEVGWSVAVGIHALAILTGGRVLDSAWQEGMALERMRRYELESASRGQSNLIERCEAEFAGSSEVRIESEVALVDRGGQSRAAEATALSEPLVSV
jgi:hypothetical protein